MYAQPEASNHIASTLLLLPPLGFLLTLCGWYFHLPVKNNPCKRHITFKKANSSLLLGKCVVLHINRSMTVNTTDNPRFPGLQSAILRLTPHAYFNGILINYLPRYTFLSLSPSDLLPVLIFCICNINLVMTNIYMAIDQIVLEIM